MRKVIPAHRLDKEAIARQHEGLRQRSPSEFLNSFPLPMAVLNPLRQIVFCNELFLRTAGMTDQDILGKRAGEAMRCIYAGDTKDGCGTASHCRVCGALQAVIEAIDKNRACERECQLLIQCESGIKARDLRVHASPWDTPDGTFYIVTIADIEDQKRRQTLERLFFHDILNTAGGAKGLTRLMLEDPEEDPREAAELLDSALFGLVEEIKKQKDLLLMEQGQFVPSPSDIEGLATVSGLAREFRAHPKSEGRTLVLAADAAEVTLSTDPILLRRALVNMLLNAVEATPAGGTVTIGVRPDNGDALFWVHNETVMDEQTRLQVFKRSFSTKGPGRGLGTYSIRMLTKNYLQGEVDFTSEEGAGTTFRIRLKAG
ncbi:ATP-binding protein [Pseudodesulfovibrio indicus]|uniref:sensor histidine kinase n=1 Tax=Pseudodesulfovibrio indicus TaxID=1716143 RepID=UPI0029312D39|nr:ATP-binding protein [Pseudodesulfovibrio indicus]